MDITEQSAALQGLQAQLPQDNFTQTYTYVAGQGISLGHKIAEGNAYGPVLGRPARPMPDGSTVAATVVVKLKSLTATATSVMVTEYE